MEKYGSFLKILTTNKIGDYKELMDYLEKGNVIPYLVFYKCRDIKPKTSSQKSTLNLTKWKTLPNGCTPTIENTISEQVSIL